MSMQSAHWLTDWAQICIWPMSPNLIRSSVSFLYSPKTLVQIFFFFQMYCIQKLTAVNTPTDNLWTFHWPTGAWNDENGLKHRIARIPSGCGSPELLSATRHLGSTFIVSENCWLKGHGHDMTKYRQKATWQPQLRSRQILNELQLIRNCQRDCSIPWKSLHILRSRSQQLLIYTNRQYEYSVGSLIWWKLWKKGFCVYQTLDILSQTESRFFLLKLGRYDALNKNWISKLYFSAVTVWEV